MKNKLCFFAALLFVVMPLAIVSFASQNNGKINPYLKDWSDIGEFFASDYFYKSDSGNTKISKNFFPPKSHTLQQTFLTRVQVLF